VPVLVSTQHDVNPRPLPHTIYRRLTGRMIDATVACSAGVMDYCRNVLHVPEDRLFLIDNGVDVERFASVGPPRRDPMTFLTLGSLSLPKGHDTLIEAFAAVARQRPGTRLLISGEGPEEGRIRDLIERMGLGDSVSILPPTLDVPGRFAATDALVQPSRREGLPVAVLEAMAARRPVIATAVSSVAEVLEDGRLGLVVPPTDASALAAGMLAVIDDPRAAAARADLAAERVARDYSIERMAAEYGVLYRRLLASSSS
jgi:glycosyltransferase involved in cell wall biosynthesis